MRGQGRPFAAGAIALALAQVALGASSAEIAKRDAQLTDVTFVDPQNGWAVGDRGVIWRTSDGGVHWREQRSGVDCRLDAVNFLDANNGWAAGGCTEPYSHTTSGVLLRTRDGGEHWLCDSKLLLPAILRVKFIDPKHGWLITIPSPLFPSCIFSTDDGGRHWTPAPAAMGGVFAAGDFLDAHEGVVAGPDSAIATVHGRSVQPAANVSLGLRSPRQVKIVDERHAWLVGEGALVLCSDDLGHTWQTPPGDPPRGMRDLFNFHALAVRGNRIWIAGAPGTCVLLSRDGGQSWNSFATGIRTPIRALTFVDDFNGWAVGDLGVILATHDGGETWKKQQAGGARAAFMAFYARPDQTPAELLAKLSADGGYLGVVEILARNDARGAERADSARRTHEATISAGGTASEFAWQFPAPASATASAEEMVELWNRANDGRGLERLEAHLVAQIRAWRPSVLFTTGSGGAHADGRDRLINQAVLRAADRAADARQYPEQLEIAGLEPWKTTKIYSSSGEESGATLLTPAEIAPRLGVTLADAAAPARGLFAERYKAAPRSIGFRLLVNCLPQSQGERDFFGGIALRPGDDARRLLEETIEQDVTALRQAAQAQRNVQALLAKAESVDNLGASRLSDVSELTRTMDQRRAAEVLYQLAERYARRGQPELAAETFEALVERAPKHPLAGTALVWLIQYHASGEIDWRRQRSQRRITQEAVSQTPVIPADFQQPEGAREPSTVVPAGGVSGAPRVNAKRSLGGNRRGPDEDHAAKATALMRQLEEINPSLSADPQVRFALAASQRAAGAPRAAERFYLGLARSRKHDAWWASAEGESWLGHAQGVSPKYVFKSPRAAVKPHLDGKLDEPIWRAAQPMELHSPLKNDVDRSAVALVAHDAEFLYLAVSCVQVPGRRYERSTGARPRDGKLDDHDRVNFYLDIDRDWSTFYRFSIDSRGWTGDACWNDMAWDPTWYVASGDSEGAWTIEAVIPFDEIAPQAPRSGAAWSLGIERVAPGVSSQSWTPPVNGESGPPSFGYLIFE